MSYVHIINLLSWNLIVRADFPPGTHKLIHFGIAQGSGVFYTAFSDVTDTYS